MEFEANVVVIFFVTPLLSGLRRRPVCQTIDNCISVCKFCNLVQENDESRTLITTTMQFSFFAFSL